jgi:hypothetical protein
VFDPFGADDAVEPNGYDRNIISPEGTLQICFLLFSASAKATIVDSSCTDIASSFRAGVVRRNSSVWIQPSKLCE